MKTENNEYTKMLPKRRTFVYSTVFRNQKNIKLKQNKYKIMATIQPPTFYSCHTNEIIF